MIRSLYKHGDTAPDLSRKVLDWMSFCVWSNYNVATKDMTVLIWRCPAQLKQKFYSTFQDSEGRKLQRHPMLIHAFLMEHIIVHTYDFLQKFSEPLYAWVCSLLAQHIAALTQKPRNSKQTRCVQPRIILVGRNHSFLSLARSNKSPLTMIFLPTPWSTCRRRMHAMRKNFLCIQ